MVAFRTQQCGASWQPAFYTKPGQGFKGCQHELNLGDLRARMMLQRVLVVAAALGSQIMVVLYTPDCTLAEHTSVCSQVVVAAAP
eukprot:363096-Chlamydomonas_euryale.AAC.3